MKKLIIIILAITVGLTSCSKDDDAIGIDADKIIGIWGNYKDIDLDDGSVWDYDPYDIENQLQFMEDGTLKAFFEETSYVEGTWENMKNGTYKMVYIGITEIIEIDFVGNNEMIFRFTDEEYYYIRIN